MTNLNVSPLARDLRALVDSAKKRLWIVSPYIGSWRAVRRILGETWEKVDVRMLTDKDSGILARDTLERFAAHRPIRSLKGVHAKLYIVDDSVLLTSANLTETAFTGDMKPVAY
jgi:phosphatidylserine/phosphatidylglycerophosphate/cardiolipin synthase-like enzyme